MISQQRFYSGKYFLPKPRLDVDSNLGLTILTLNWGDPSATDFFIDSLKYQLTSISENTEITRIGKSIETPQHENPDLAAAVLGAHEQIERKYNSQEYTTIIELVILKKQGHRVQWLKVGGPSLLLAREKDLICLEHTHGLSAQHGQRAPMVTNGLGTSDPPLINQGIFHINPGERIVLLNRDSLPSSLYLSELRNLDAWSGQLAQDDPQVPFWIGMVESN